MLLGPSRAELKSILVESFPTPPRLKGFVRDHLTTPIDYERSGLKHEENVGELIDTLDSAGLLDTFLKEVQREFQGDVPKRSAQVARILREYYAGPPANRVTRVTQRLNTREGMYASLTGMSALAILHPTLKAMLTRLANTELPFELFYAASGLMGLLTLGMVWKVFRRRSKVLRPEKFIIRPEDPHCFIGREREVADLWQLCDQRSLVLLLGESGSGKSTLARYGLQSKFRAAGDATPRWHSVMIDGSTITQWNGGLAAELTRQLLHLTPDVRENLGAARPPLTDDVFSWIESWSKAAATRLLISFDQLDDYFETHRSRLMEGSRLLSPEELLATNADWQRLAQLCQDDRIHLLLICRSDSLAHVVFRIASSSSMPLSRIDSDLVAPLLTTITEPDGDDPVIENPGDGWTHLSPRLVDDLGRGGGVLPVQLVITLDALGKVRWLDSSEYAVGGGLSGLGRQYIDGRIAEAVQLGGATPTDLLRGFVALTTQDGKKTIPLSPEQFQAVVAGSQPTDPRLEAVINHLCGQRILRKRESSDGQVVQLYHDFLAKPVREKSRLANAEADLLETRTQEFKQAYGLVGHWRALLSLREQLRIVWAKSRGRLLYGPGARLAQWSLARSLAIVMALCVSGLVGSHQISKQADYSKAKDLLSGVGNLDTSVTSQVNSIRSLSEANLRIRYHAFETGISKDHIGKVIHRLPLFLHTTLGLADDPQPFAEAIVKRMKTVTDSASLYSLGVALGSLSGTLEAKDVQPGADTIVKQMQSETDSSKLSELGKALGSLIGTLEAKDVQRGAAAIVKRMENDIDIYQLSVLSEVLGSLSAKLDSEDLQRGAAVIVKRMQSETSQYNVAHLGVALESLSAKLEAQDVQSLAAAMLNQLENETDFLKRPELAKALGSLSAKLEVKVVQKFAAEIVERIKTETDSSKSYYLGEVLGNLSAKLESQDVQPFAAIIEQIMEDEIDSDKLARLGAVLGSLSGKLEAKDVKPGAAAIVKRIKNETDSGKLSRLCASLGSLSEKLETQDLQQFAAAIMKRMKNETDSSEFTRLAEVLASLSAKLETQAVQQFAAKIVNRMQTNIDSNNFSRLVDVFGSLSDRLEAKYLQQVAAEIVKQMQNENGSHYISSLGEAFERLGAVLESQVLQQGAAVIARRMETELNPYHLSILSKVLGSLSAKLETQDVHSLAAEILKRMENESDSDKLSVQGMAIGSLSAKLAAKDVHPGAAAIMKRIESEIDSGKLARLGVELGSLSAKLEAQDVQQFATAIVKRMKNEDDSSNLSTLGNMLGNLSAKLEAKDVQPGAAEIVKQMKNEDDSSNLSELVKVFGSLSAKLEVQDVQQFATATVKRMENETDSGMLARLGVELGSLSAKLEAQEVQQFAAAIVKRMETETNSSNLSELGKALESLSAKLEVQNLQSGVAAIVKAMETETFSYHLSGLGKALGSLSARLEREDQLRLFDLLKNPFIVGDARDALLKGFDDAGIFGEKLFKDEAQNLDIWKYVRWANGPQRSGKHGIDLRRTPNESAPQLSP